MYNDPRFFYRPELNKWEYWDYLSCAFLNIYLAADDWAKGF